MEIDSFHLCIFSAYHYSAIDACKIQGVTIKSKFWGENMTLPVGFFVYIYLCLQGLLELKVTIYFTSLCS